MFIYHLVSPKTGCNVEKIHTMRTEANPDAAVRCSEGAQNAFYTTNRLPKKLRFNVHHCRSNNNNNNNVRKCDNKIVFCEEIR